MSRFYDIAPLKHFKQLVIFGLFLSNDLLDFIETSLEATRPRGTVCIITSFDAMIFLLCPFKAISSVNLDYFQTTIDWNLSKFSQEVHKSYVTKGG